MKKRFSDLPILYPEHWRLWCEEEAHFCAPGGESAVQVHNRISRAIDRIAAENEWKDHRCCFPRLRFALLFVPCAWAASRADRRDPSFSEHSGKPGDL